MVECTDLAVEVAVAVAVGEEEDDLHGGEEEDMVSLEDAWKFNVGGSLACPAL